MLLHRPRRRRWAVINRSDYLCSFFHPMYYYNIYVRWFVKITIHARCARVAAQGNTRSLKLADSSIIIIFAPNRTIAVHSSIYSCYRVVMIIEIDHNDNNNKNNIFYKCYIIVNVKLNSCSKNTHWPCEDNAIARIIRTRKTHREQYTTAAAAAAAPVQWTVL